jgi:hypothetical protein
MGTQLTLIDEAGMDEISSALIPQASGEVESLSRCWEIIWRGGDRYSKGRAGIF